MKLLFDLTISYSSVMLMLTSYFAFKNPIEVLRLIKVQ